MTSMFTKAVHAGDDHEQHFGALSVPIYPASVFAFSDADEASAIHNEEKPGYYYGRLGNPTQTALEASDGRAREWRGGPCPCIRNGGDLRASFCRS